MSLIADVRINNQYIRVINNHFETTSVNAYRGIITAPGKSLEVRAKAVKDLVLKMKCNYLKRAEQADSIHAEIERSPYPVLVCGDFNDTPMSYVYRTMAKGLNDAFSQCGSGYSHTFRGFFNTLRIDYVLSSEGFDALSYEVPTVDYSDHHPVVVRLRKSS